MSPKSSASRSSKSTSGVDNNKRQPVRKRGRPQLVKAESSSLWRQKLVVTCLICEKRCASYSHLEMHMNVHTRERPYECGECNDNFGFLSAANTHKYNVHRGVRYPCNLCNKTFTTLANLSAHKRSHYPERKQKKLATSGFKLAMKKTPLTRRNSRELEKNKCKVSAKNTSRQPNSSNDNMSEREAVTEKEIGEPVRKYCSKPKRRGTKRRAYCKIENLGAHITPIMPPPKIVQREEQTPDDSNGGAISTSSNRHELAEVEKKILRITLTRVQLNKAGSYKHVIPSSKSVQKEDKNDFDDDVQTVSVQNDEVAVEIEKRRMPEIENEEEIHVEEEPTVQMEEEETIVDVEEEEVNRLAKMEDDEAAIVDVEEEEKCTLKLENKKKIIEEDEKKDEINGEVIDEEEIFVDVESEEFNEGVEENKTLNQGIDTEEVDIVGDGEEEKLKKEIETEVGEIEEEEETNGLIDGEVKISENNCVEAEEDMDVIIDLEATEKNEEEKKCSNELEEINERLIVEEDHEAILKEDVASTFAEDKKGETINSENSNTNKVDLCEVNVKVEENIQVVKNEEEQQQDCKNEQMEVSEEPFIKEESNRTEQTNQVPGNLISEKQEASQAPWLCPQLPGYQFPTAEEIPPISYADKSTIPIVVEVDPVTGKQTPFPPPATNPPSNRNAGPPNLFFSVNGKIIMPLFTVDMFRVLGPLSRSSWPTPTIERSDDEDNYDEEDSSEAEVEDEEEDQQMEPQPSTSKEQLSRGRTVNKSGKVKRKRSTSDSSWSSAAPKSTNKNRRKYHQGPIRNGAHKCPTCKLSFNFKCHLSRHIFSAHMSDVKPFSCEFCPISYRTKPTLLDHIMTKHCQKDNANGRNSVLYCPFCEDDNKNSDEGSNIYFSQKKDLHNHLMKQHLKNMKVSNFYQNSALPSSKSGETQPKKNSSRPKTSAAVSSSSKVLKREKKRKLAQKKRSVTVNATLKKSNATFRRRLPKTSAASAVTSKCPFCDRRFREGYHLNNHLRIHTGEKPYACTMCPAHFTRKDSLIKHLVHLHSSVQRSHKKHGNKRFSSGKSKNMDILCGICKTARLASREELIRHIHVDHSDLLMATFDNK